MRLKQRKEYKMTDFIDDYEEDVQLDFIPKRKKEGIEIPEF